MRVLVIVVIVVVIVVVTWESKANSSSSLTELQTGTELGNKHKKHRPGSSRDWSFQPMGSETTSLNLIRQAK